MKIEKITDINHAYTQSIAEKIRRDAHHADSEDAVVFTSERESKKQENTANDNEENSKDKELKTFQAFMPITDDSKAEIKVLDILV